MDIGLQLTLVLLGLFLVFLNGFFVASEFSIVKVRHTRLQELIQQGSGRASNAGKLVEKMDEYLSATQLGITLASLGLGWIGEPAFATLFQPLFEDFGGLPPVFSHTLSFVCAFVLITFLHIVLGELAPKTLAIQRAETVVMWTATPLIWFYRLTYPFIWSLNGTAAYLLRLAGLTEQSESSRAHSEEELRMILAYSQEKGILGRDEKGLLDRVFDFADRSVRQVMVPSVEVAYLDVQKTLEENLEIARRQEHTRYPLCDGGLDRVVGIVHTKDVFWKIHEIGLTFELKSVMRPVLFVPETKFIISLLAELRDARSHMAIVVDEYGSTVGIVTLEDILEELVGEIEDEFDIEVAPPLIRDMDGHFMVNGRTIIEEVAQTLGIKIEDAENDTIAGHVMMVLGRTARLGDEVPVGGNFRARVVGMKGFQITDLRFEPLTREETGPRE